jgi:hypothetical protein
MNLSTTSVSRADFESRLAAAFSPFDTNPEARRKIGLVALDRVQKVIRDVNSGLAEMVGRTRTKGEMEAERNALLAKLEADLVQQGMATLAPSALAAYQQEIETLKDNPLVSAMLGMGRLMSRTTAEREGRLKTDGTGNAGDYNSAPWLPPAWYAPAGGIMPRGFEELVHASSQAGERLGKDKRGRPPHGLFAGPPACHIGEMRRRSLLALAALPAGPAAAQAPDRAATLAAVEHHLNGLTTLRARFLGQGSRHQCFKFHRCVYLCFVVFLPE